MQPSVVEHFAVVVSGFDRAGKSTFAEFLAHRFAWTVREVGDLTRSMQADDPSLSRVASEAYQEIRGSIEPSRIAQILASDIARDRPAIICGVRDFALMKSLETIFPRTVVVWIEADRLVRFGRPSRNQENSLDSLARSDQLAINWGIHEIRDRADFRIVNEGASISSYLGQADRMTSSVLGGSRD